jgi:peptidoglycan/LPS O-acetylase OafA/YrhL
MDRAPPLHPLTSLRFFAAIIVVLYHTYAVFLPGKPLPAFADDTIAVGFIGVSFFFILSGFILAYNYMGPPGETARLEGPDQRRSFFVARFARVYPLYLLALFVHAPFVVAHRLHQDPSLPVALGKILVSFTVNGGLIQAWLRKLWGGWNGPGWSLSAEAFFYAVFPFVAPLLWRSRHRDMTLLLFVYAAALAVPIIVVLLEHWGPLELQGTDGFQTFPLLRLPEFLFGIVLARAHLRARAEEISPWIFRRPAALWIGGVLLVSGAILGKDRIPELFLHDGLLAPAFALVILGFSRGGGPLHRLLSTRPLILLGEASYGVYILHIPLFFWCCYLARDEVRLSDNPALFGVDKPVLCVVYLASVIGLSMLSLRFVEEPVRHWIRRFAGRQRGSADTASRRLRAAAGSERGVGTPPWN